MIRVRYVRQQRVADCRQDGYASGEHSEAADYHLPLNVT